MVRPSKLLQRRQGSFDHRGGLTLFEFPALQQARPYWIPPPSSFGGNLTSISISPRQHWVYSRAGISPCKTYFVLGRYVEAEQQLVRQYCCLSYEEYRLCCNPTITPAFCISGISKLNYYTFSQIMLLAAKFTKMYNTLRKNKTKFQRRRPLGVRGPDWKMKIIYVLKRRYFINELHCKSDLVNIIVEVESI